MTFFVLCYLFFVTRIVPKIVSVLLRVKSAGFNVYIAGNMFLCSLLFCFWAKPRETISGFIGRKALTGSSMALYVARAIDKMYPNEKAHCGETALAEDEIRFILYPQDQIDTGGLNSAHPDLNPRADDSKL